MLQEDKASAHHHSTHEKKNVQSTPQKSPISSIASHTLRNETDVSACLIVKDDNHWLIKWIAYHYHVMPLHHSIDTKSNQSYIRHSRLGSMEGSHPYRGMGGCLFFARMSHASSTATNTLVGLFELTNVSLQ
jgi:hypothetical protein